MNTKITSIANNYADGIIEYAAGDLQKLDKILYDFENIKLALKQSFELNEVLKNPTIDFDKKSEIIESVFGGVLDEHEKNLLRVLIEKQRFGEFANIISALKTKIEDLKGEKEVFVTSAIALDEVEKSRIIEKLQQKLQKKVIANWLEDKRIIGGLVIQIDDDVIDMSLLNKIESLSKNIIK